MTYVLDASVAIAAMRLREPGYFSRVSIAWGALTWPEGEDVSPESVAAQLVG